MSVIQTIRDKYARIAVIAIGLALLGFILMDAFAGRGSFLGGQDNTLGEIDGKDIDARTFMRRVEEIEKQNNQVTVEQIVNQLWNDELTDAVMGKQYEELGLTVTTKELDQLMYGTNPSPVIKQAFGNPQTWDGNAVRQRLSEIKRSGTVEEKAQVTQLEEAVMKQALMSKYTALLSNSVNVPKWFIEKRAVDNSQMVKGAYVAVPYTLIADSTVKVTDDEINAYVRDHKKDFEMKEEGRSISYVQFSASPSSADSAAVRNRMLSVRDSFTSTPNVKDFLLSNRSQLPYNDNWVAKSDLQQLQNADSIFKAPTGVVVGPIVEPQFKMYLMTKIVDRKTQPDTAKVRHILIQTDSLDQQNRQFIPVRDSVSAKKTADSLLAAINSGANFDTLIRRFSQDPSKVINNGVFDSITRNAQLMQEFKDFALNNNVGYKGITRTSYGYHIIEVLNQRGSSEVAKLAVFALPIDVSEETESTASNAANALAGTATDEKSFNDYFEKNLKAQGYNKIAAPNLRPMAYNIGNIEGNARELVKAVFEADKGDVLTPKRVGSSYIVALVTDVSKPGLPSAAVVRPMVEPILLNKKKAEKIKQQMGTVTDLNAVATKFNQQVQTIDSASFNGRSALGYEPKVLGAMFNPAIKGKVSPEAIDGQLGVYAIRVDNTFTGAVDNANVELLRKDEEMRMRQQVGSPLELLKKRIEIKDNRAKFY